MTPTQKAVNKAVQILQDEGFVETGRYDKPFSVFLVLPGTGVQASVGPRYTMVFVMSRRGVEFSGRVATKDADGLVELIQRAKEKTTVSNPLQLKRALSR